MVIGLTGGSGCGKTTALEILREMGGVFETHQEDKKFLVEISLPCVQEPQP